MVDLDARRSSDSSKGSLLIDGDEFSRPRGYVHICRSMKDVFPPGFWSDFYYYSSNNHPVQGIFLCDRFHPLDWKERAMMELSTMCSTWFVMWLVAIPRIVNMFHLVPSDEAGPRMVNHFLFSLVFATLPGMVWWYSLFFLYTAPCANNNDAASSVTESRRSGHIRRISELIGHALVVTSLILPFASRLIEDDQRFEGAGVQKGISDAIKQLPICSNGCHIKVLVAVMSGRFKAYIISWLLMFFVYFNPVVAVGEPSPLAERSLLSLIIDLVGLGQWRIEKMRFKALCEYGLRQLEKGLASPVKNAENDPA
jgi:hypothetical protein